MRMPDVALGAAGETAEARQNAGPPVQVKHMREVLACGLDNEVCKRGLPAAIGSGQNDVEAGLSFVRDSLQAVQTFVNYCRPAQYPGKGRCCRSIEPSPAPEFGAAVYRPSRGTDEMVWKQITDECG